MTQTTTKKPLSILDLTVAQTEKVEEEMGLPMSKWGEANSLARLITSVLAAVEGKERSEYAHLTMRELIALVDLKGDEDPNL